MGAAFYIVLDSEIEGFDPLVDGKAVATAVEELDQAAVSIGIPGINEFVSCSHSELSGLAEDFGVEDFAAESISE